MLPLESLSEETGELLGRAVEEDISVEVDRRPEAERRRIFFRVRVSTLVFRDGPRRWILCCYDRVGKLCRACGRIGRTILIVILRKKKPQRGDMLG